MSTIDKKNGKPTGRWRADALGAIALIAGLTILYRLAAIVREMLMAHVAHELDGSI